MATRAEILEKLREGIEAQRRVNDAARSFGSELELDFEDAMAVEELTPSPIQGPSPSDTAGTRFSRSE